jgi:ATP-dependent DNA helicase RecG
MTLLPPHHPQQGMQPAALTSAAFEGAYPHETEYVEFKTSAGRQLQEPIVAFSNSKGGVILIGVRDGGQLVGRMQTAQPTIDEVHAVARDVRNPGPYEVSVMTVDGVIVVVVSVANKHSGFAQTSNGQVMVRRGTSNTSLFGAELAQFITERGVARFEDAPTEATVADIDFDLLQQLAELHGWNVRDEGDSQARLREKGYLQAAPSRRLTVAGTLFLTQKPGQFLGNAEFDVVRFKDDHTDIYDRRDRFDGPVHRQVAEVTKHVAAELGQDIVVTGVYRWEMPKIPEEVLREVIANAAGHRAYEMTGSAVVVELRPSSVVVRSPGNLVHPVTEENIRQTTAARNPAVLDTLRRFRLAEALGRGVDLIQDKMQEALLDPPQFHDLEHAVEVILPLHSPVTPVERAWLADIEQRGELQAADRLLLAIAARGEQLSNARAREILGVDRDQALAALKRLCAAGVLRQSGSRGGVRYALGDVKRPPAAFRLSFREIANLLVEDARRNGPLSNARVRQLTGLERAHALDMLRRLVESGTLRVEGERRGVRYHPVD